MIDTLLIGANHRDRDSSTGVGPIDPQQIFAFASVPLGPIISAASNTSDTARSVSQRVGDSFLIY